jgi:hypothetical protein
MNIFKITTKERKKHKFGLVFPIFYLLTAICLCFATRSLADIVVLNQDQPGDYIFQSGNTYYLTNSVNIYGTAIFQTNVVIKFATNGLDGNGGLFVEDVDFQTTPDFPVIFTTCSDDRFGDTLPDSTHSPTIVNAAALNIQSANNSVAIHDAQFYDFTTAIEFQGQNGGEQTINLWNIYIEDCNLGMDCNSDILCLTNLTMLNCGELADDYDVSGSAFDCTFLNSGFIADSWSYFFNDFNFSWCVFSNNSLASFELNIHGDHNGFYNCGTFSDYDMNQWSDDWYLATNYFGVDWYWLTNSTIQFYLLSTNNFMQSSNASVQVDLWSGTVFYKAILVNDTNLDDAVWTDYTPQAIST